MDRKTESARDDREAAYRHLFFGCDPRPGSWELAWIEDPASEPERVGPTDQLRRLADDFAARRAKAVTAGYLGAVVTMLRTPPKEWDLAHKVLAAACIKPADVKASGFSVADRVRLMGALKVKL